MLILAGNQKRRVPTNYRAGVVQGDYWRVSKTAPTHLLRSTISWLMVEIPTMPGTSPKPLFRSFHSLYINWTLYCVPMLEFEHDTDIGQLNCFGQAIRLVTFAIRFITCDCQL